MAVAPAEAPWLQRLRERVGRQPADSQGLEQSSLFQQVSNVLCSLAEAHPLLLVLDDLQWADTASIGLLFHLGRRLEGARILIAGAYRSEEVALGRGRERHPLQKVLSEFKRNYGDVWLDLAEVEKRESRCFVDALLEIEPNRLGEAFRRLLADRAGGQPLFTIELLRAMQARGELVQDELGHWIEGRVLDWETLPARVEGVIEERVARLEPELREILSVASVEGEEFTAQVVAQVQGVGERQLLGSLSQELQQRHRLVREQGAVTVEQRRLSRYRFAHVLFQQYLYGHLAEGERRLLHGQIAAVLEGLYKGSTETVAVQLARHYSEAGDEQRTLKYLTLAGDVARASYANEEAMDYYNRALELAPADHAEQRYAMLLAREALYELQGAMEERARDVAALEALAEALDMSEKPAGRSRRAEAALRRADYERRIGNPEAAFAAVRAAVRLAREAQDIRCEADARKVWGDLLLSQGEYETARQQFEQALARARESGAPQVEAGSLTGLGWVFWCQGIDYPTVNTTCYEQALDLYRESGDRRGEAHALYDLGVLHVGGGDLLVARSHYEQARGIYREIGDRSGESVPLHAIAWVYWGEDDYAGARASLEQALAIDREVGNRSGEGGALLDIGLTLGGQGYYARGEALCQQALSIFRETGQRGSEGGTLSDLGLLRFYQGDYAGARMLLKEAGALCSQFAARWTESKRLAVLSLVLHALGDDEAARDHAQQALRNGPERYHLGQGDSALVLGHALAGLRDRAGATAAYYQALDRYRQSGFLNPPMEALAGLARLELAGEQPAQALEHVVEILTHLQTHSLDGTYEPFRIYWTCCRVLKGHDDGRAAELLRTACRLLQERAAGIEDDDLRRSFLEGVPVHQWLIQEGQRLHARGPDPRE
jgi:tetratricopeptide (TPR) repeat protein